MGSFSARTSARHPVRPAAAETAWLAAIVAIAVLYYEISNAPLSLVLLLILAYLSWKRTSMAVALVPLAVPLYMLPKTVHAGRQLSFSLGETVIVLLVVIVLAQQASTLKSRPATVSALRHFVPATPFLWPAIAFLLAAALAVLTARFHTVAIRQYRETIAEPVLYYWLITQRIKGLGGAMSLALSVVAAGTIVSLMGVFQILFRPQDMEYAANISPPQHFVVAVYSSENNLALLIDRALPMALALVLAPGWVWLLVGGRDAMARQRVTRVARGGLVACGLLMAYVLYRTGSRGGEIATLLCVAVLYAVWQWGKRYALAAGAVLVAAAALVERHHISSFVSGSHGLSNDAHQSVWQSALRMIRDHPVFGVGPDNFLYYYSNDSTCAPGHITHYYYEQAGVNFDRCISHPHNMFLDFWLSTGILGLIAGLVLIGFFAVLGIRAFREAGDRWRSPVLGALVAMLAFIAHGQVDNSYFLPDLAVYFWLCLGIVTLFWEQHGSGHPAL